MEERHTLLISIAIKIYLDQLELHVQIVIFSLILYDICRIPVPIITIVYIILLTARTLLTPKSVKVYTEDDQTDSGVWKMNIEWMDGLANSITPDTVTYDIKIFYTEQKELVHNVSGCSYNKAIKSQAETFPLQTCYAFLYSIRRTRLGLDDIT